jgi:lysylphosphatidylglycerol synthetase-like protein (DUF2156 family)
MTTYYKATFSNGVIARRSTAGRTYTHAWLVGYPRYQAPNETWHESGFSGSEQLARKALAGWTRGDLTFTGIAPVVEITSKEYRALK